MRFVLPTPSFALPTRRASHHFNVPGGGHDREPPARCLHSLVCALKPYPSTPAASSHLVLVMAAVFANSLGNPRTRRLLIVAAATLSVIAFLYSASDTTYASNVKAKLPSWQGSFSSSPAKVEPIVLDPQCANLPGAEDVLLVMKTGSSVIDKRLPIHFTTTFRCTPDFLVFSDMAQDFHGLQIHDSLDELYKYVDMSNPDLKYYEYLKKQGARKQKGWSIGSWTGKEEKFETKESDAAWEMDKYKNIPILRKSYAMYSEKKWFLFVDADTSIMWSNILTWLAQLDHTKPFYTGSQNWIGDVEFAHGGSGYIVSQAAARILANEAEEKAKEHIRFAAHECCGDMVLAHAFHDNNIALNGSWPNIQGSKPDTLDYDKNKWCHAAMTFHHTTAEQTEKLWKLDREMENVKVIRPIIPTHITLTSCNTNKYLTEHNLLRHLLLPHPPRPPTLRHRMGQRLRRDPLPPQTLPR